MVVYSKNPKAQSVRSAFSPRWRPLRDANNRLTEPHLLWRG